MSKQIDAICSDLIERGKRLGDQPRVADYVLWKADVYAYTRAAKGDVRIEDLSKLLDIDEAFWRGETTPPAPNRAKGRDEVCEVLTDWCGKKR